MKKARCGDCETPSAVCPKKAKVSTESEDSLARKSQSLGSLADTSGSLSEEDTKDGFDEMTPQASSSSLSTGSATPAVMSSSSPLSSPSSASTSASGSRLAAPTSSDPVTILSSHPLSNRAKPQSIRSPVTKNSPSESSFSSKRGSDTSTSFGSEPQTPIIDGTDPIEQLRDLCGAIVGSAESCGKRPQMEDAHVIVPNLAGYMDEKSQDSEVQGTNYSAFCVLDGHAGDRVSQYVVKNLPLRLKSEIEKINAKKDSHEKEKEEADEEKDIVDALLNAHKMVDNEVIDAAKSAMIKWKDGSTAITVLMENTDKLYIANLGDCRAVLATLSDENEKALPPSSTSPSSQQQQQQQQPSLSSSLSASSYSLPLPAPSPPQKEANEEKSSVSSCSVGGKEEERKKMHAVALSNDHHPSVQEEADRIKKCGGYVSVGRLMGIIEVSRAFGDLRFRNNGLIGDPEITVHKIDKEKDKFLIIASDGVWKVVPNELAVELVSEWLGNETDVQSVALKLIQKAYSMGSTDNATVIIVVFPFNN